MRIIRKELDAVRVSVIRAGNRWAYLADYRGERVYYDFYGHYSHHNALQFIARCYWETGQKVYILPADLCDEEYTGLLRRMEITVIGEYDKTLGGDNVVER